MKHENINYIAVGSFVLAVLAAFIVMVIMLTGRGGDTDTYQVYYNNVAGIKYGTLVSYEGYQLGQVESVEPVQGDGKTRYLVTFTIQKDWKVPSDSIAQIVSSGLLGAIAINIREGKSDTSLKVGGTLKGLQGADLFSAVGGAAGDIKLLIADVRDFVSTLNAEAKIFGDVRKFVATLNKETDIFKDVHKLLKRLDNSAAGLESIMNQGNQENIGSIIENITRASQRLDNTLNEIDTVVNTSNTLVTDNRSELQRSIRHLSASLEVISTHASTIAHNLDGTSRNLNEFSRQIRENPGLLLGSTPPQDKTQKTGK